MGLVSGWALLTVAFKAMDVSDWVGAASNIQRFVVSNGVPTAGSTRFHFRRRC